MKMKEGNIEIRLYPKTHIYFLFVNILLLHFCAIVDIKVLIMANHLLIIHHHQLSQCYQLVIVYIINKQSTSQRFDRYRFTKPGMQENWQLT